MIVASLTILGTLVPWTVPENASTMANWYHLSSTLSNIEAVSAKTATYFSMYWGRVSISSLTSLRSPNSSSFSGPLMVLYSGPETTLYSRCSYDLKGGGKSKVGKSLPLN